MNSQVIKYVAGGGKTTYSRGLLKDNSRGLYLTYNNSVKDELLCEGHLAMTLDSFLTGFIIPKAIPKIPLIPDGVKIKLNETTGYESGSRNISINPDGTLCNQSKRIDGISLCTQYDTFSSMPNFTNIKFLKIIFQKDILCLSHEQRDELANFIITNYKEYIIDIIRRRFAYIIIDEAQDIKVPKESLVEMLRNSGVPTIILGDENQNINNGSEWFSNLQATNSKTLSRRCGDGVCGWIRDNLGISITGHDRESSYNKIKYTQVLDFDDGKRFLLYKSANGKNIKSILSVWNGPKSTIQGTKGSTIEEDVIIIGDSMSRRFLYTAVTRTRKSVYSTITRIND
ncbi:MAG: UvrD-helicase domain-containing protein [Candidatus Saccharibacteria bacterium]|nr:UvrD-helicase domain-containing protein [Candidatus Saccharibacteria bacterium]